MSKLLKFHKCNVALAEDQEQYETLHCYRDEEGQVTMCVGLTLKERIQILFRGHFYWQQMTFNKPLQPVLPIMHSPFPTFEEGKPEKMVQTEEQKAQWKEYEESLYEARCINYITQNYGTFINRGIRWPFVTFRYLEFAWLAFNAIWIPLFTVSVIADGSWLGWALLFLVVWLVGAKCPEAVMYYKGCKHVSQWMRENDS